MSGSPMDPDQAAREWAQNSADNDGRRWLAVKLHGAGQGVYGAACVLADLGPRGSKTTRIDREDAVRVLLTEMSKDRARAKLYRSRCPVEASDVETAGVTLPQHARPWMKKESKREPDWLTIDAASIATYINAVAPSVGRPAMVILDEMALEKSPEGHPDAEV